MALGGARRAAAGAHRRRRRSHRRRLSRQPHQRRRGIAGERGAGGGHPSRLAAAVERSVLRRGRAPRAARGAQHAPALGGLQRRRQSADERRGGDGGLPAARAGTGGRGAVREGHAGAGHSGRRRGVAGLQAPRRGRRPGRLAAVDRGGEFSRGARADLAPRPGRHVRGAGAEPDHECGRSARHTPDPTRQPRELQRPVRR